MAFLKKDSEVERLKAENEKLKTSLKELAILNELSTLINSTMSSSKVMEKVVAESVKAINAEQGTIHLLDKDKEKVDPFRTFIRKADESQPANKFRLDQELSGWMMMNRKPLVVNDFQNNKQFFNREAGNVKIRTLLTVPLICKGELVGVLNLFNKKNTDGFSENDQRLLSIIASQSAQVIENSRLYEQEKQLIKIEKELEMAYSIQQKLLPKESPDIPGFDIAGLSYAAKDVGGDYFDYIKLDDERWCIALGDVSGKGIPAALLMSHLQATMRYQIKGNPTIKECISKANNFICANTEDNRFVTLFGGILDVKNKVFNYVNAGHNLPFYLSGDELIPLRDGGLVMGMMPDVPYDDNSIKFKKDELVVIYSDGVTEAHNEMDDMYGEKRLQDLIVKNRNKSATEIASEIYKAVKEFERNMEQDDDITIVVIKAI